MSVNSVSLTEKIFSDRKIDAEGKNIKSIKSKQGFLYINDSIFSGMIYYLYPNSTDTLKIENYSNGKENGYWFHYYPNHILKEKRFFTNGKKEGEHIGFYKNGQKKFLYHLKNDVYEGNNREWTIDGMLVKDMNYQLGQEQGSQKIWYDNGKIKANYVIKDGRRYGLLGTKNCQNVSDSVFNVITRR
ncbi:toxin-antitoxin system YwqK family antitoxin [Bernardetia sp. Wsw4-3y2]|uniref:toxin-antitoxin system YwqK family antitoxin n=1 Tax=Bernardetia sp. Wsw4-3y2 TaxID=3127471 RepID=UPI0030D100A2